MNFITTSCIGKNEKEGIHAFLDNSNQKVNIAFFCSDKTTGGIFHKIILKLMVFPLAQQIKRVEIVYLNLTHLITQFRPL